MIQRRDFALRLPAAAAVAALPAAAWAQADKTTLTLGMTLEPPGLDPTAGAASAIAEVTLYNLFETLTKIQPDGSVAPLLAESWQLSPDLRTLTFQLRKGVQFSNGQPFNAQAVKFSFERAASAQSTNKDRQFFSTLQNVQVLGDHALAITLPQPDPDVLFQLGQATAIIVEPQSAASNAAQPVGTGPYVLERWSRGSSLRLRAWPGWRAAKALRIQRATFRFIGDPAAQVAAMLSGDVQLFARIAPRGAARLKADARLQTLVCNSRAKTVLAINNARKPLDDVRVRRAIAAAIDRQALIAGAGDGLGAPIGSHYTPGAPGYVDTTGINPYNPAKARALLQQAGVRTPLELSLVLPPPPYARQGGEVVAAQLARVGITARVQNVEWAQWLANVYGGAHNYDLTIVSHVEPFDLGNFAKPGYYWGYHSAQFNELLARIRRSTASASRLQLLAEAQRLLAHDAVLAWLYQPQWLTAADKRLQGLWPDMPIFVNDLSALHWA